MTNEEAFRQIKERFPNAIGNDCDVTAIAWMAFEALKRQKHGNWFLLDECSNTGVYCSVRHKKVYKADYANQKVKSRFCPNCGAIMDGEFEKY